MIRVNVVISSAGIYSLIQRLICRDTRGHLPWGCWSRDINHRDLPLHELCMIYLWVIIGVASENFDTCYDIQFSIKTWEQRFALMPHIHLSVKWEALHAWHDPRRAPKQTIGWTYRLRVHFGNDKPLRYDAKINFACLRTCILRVESLWRSRMLFVSSSAASLEEDDFCGVEQSTAHRHSNLYLMMHASAARFKQLQ